MVFGIADILNQWQNIGVFDFVLPFLFVFAMVFGILSFTRIFGDNKGIHLILAFVVGMMALQWQGFIEFTKEIFPQLGIGLTIIFTAFILISMFISEGERKYWGWGLGALGVIAFLVISYNSLENLGFLMSNNFLGDNLGYFVGAILIVGLIIAVVSTRSEGERHGGAKFGPFFEPKS